jgi:hypothetical protein
MVFSKLLGIPKPLELELELEEEVSAARRVVAANPRYQQPLVLPESAAKTPLRIIFALAAFTLLVSPLRLFSKTTRC